MTIYKPAKHSLPAGHEIHADMLLPPHSVLYVYFGQLIGTDIPAGQYLPGGQGPCNIWEILTVSFSLRAVVLIYLNGGVGDELPLLHQYPDAHISITFPVVKNDNYSMGLSSSP